MANQNGSNLLNQLGGVMGARNRLYEFSKQGGSEMEVRKLPESELTHHGILGMHWGVRRYQNKDGTLTSTGRARKNRGIIETYQNKKKMKKLRQAKEAKKAEKEKIESIVKSGDAEKIKKISHKLNDEQMAEAIKKLQFNAALDEYKTGKQVNTAKKGKSYLETAAVTMQTLGNMAVAAGQVYNTLEKVGVVGKPSASQKAYDQLKRQSEMSNMMAQMNINNAKNNILRNGTEEQIYNLLKKK